MDSRVIDVAMGLFAIFLFLSMIASTTVEWLSTSWLARLTGKWGWTLFPSRSGNLRQALEKAFGKQVCDNLFAQPLLKAHGQDGQEPSYLSAHNFALALLALAANGSDASGVSAADAPADTARRTVPASQPSVGATL